MFSRRGYPLILGLVTFAFLAPGCDSDQRRPKGPNPYRREIRAAKPSATTSAAAGTDLAASRLDRLAGANAAAPGVPASAPAPALSPWLPRNTIGATVMFVNKDVITIQDVLLPIRPELERAAAALPPRQYITKAAQLIRKEMDRQVFFAVVYQEAKKSISDEEDKQYFKAADAEIQQIVNLQFGGLHAKFEKHLADQGLTIADVREKTKRRFVVLKFLADRFRPLAEHPKRDQLKKYYDEHKVEFTTPARARMSLIEVSFDAEITKPRSNATAADLAAAKEAGRRKIERARQELESGVPFAAVARKYSDGVHAADGGAWDEFGPASLRERYKAVCDALVRMSPGQVSGVIEGTDAFFVVRCDALQPERRRTFEETQPQIAERILEEKYGQMQDKYVRDLLIKAVFQNETEFFQAVLTAAPMPTEGPAPGTYGPAASDQP
jgi:parvulin-like peptidyl-prolyl isomerase